jgi:Helix-turn-helix domain
VTQPRLPADVIAAVHHPTRRRILAYLGLHGPCTVGTLAAVLGEQAGSISHHLKSLAKAGCVEPAVNERGDRRESWWQAPVQSLTWSVTDFDPVSGERLMAEAAEAENLRFHASKVTDWFGMREEYDQRWVHAAFSTDTWCRATPEELADLGARIGQVVDQWVQRLGETKDAAREPVFVFAHGVPARP